MIVKALSFEHTPVYQLTVEHTFYSRKHLFAKREERKVTRTYVKYGAICWLRKETKEEYIGFHSSKTKKFYDWLEQEAYVALLDAARKVLGEMREIESKMKSHSL